MGKPIIDDEPWKLIEPPLPPAKLRRRTPASDRAAQTGMSVPKTIIRRRNLPAKMGCCSGECRWRRLRDWQQDGVWDALQALLLAKLRAANQIDFSRIAVGSSSIRAVGAGGKTGPYPTDRARPSSEHRLSINAHGAPFSTIPTGGNCNDVRQLIQLVETIVPIQGVRGRPLSDPKRVHTDRGCDHDTYRRILHERHIPTSISRCVKPHGSGLRKARWVVERTHACLHHFRRQHIRFERRADVPEACLKLGNYTIYWNTWQRTHQALLNRLLANKKRDVA
ncbi:IS5 family transposase [Burkholderia ubonensis]|uniref:IS5 family transposase n=1 Tax=Burkholderia ubonensis TaxID=101571 RepID=UPI000B4E48DD|nr:IS5 family transposase [Burkholderia ubonensis]